VNTARPLGAHSEPADASSAAAKQLRIFPFPAGPQVVLIVEGEADISNARALRDHLIEAAASGQSALIVDLVDLDFCDLSGLDAMREAAAIAETAGASITFRGMSRRLRWLDGTFPFQMPGQRSSIA
jgi:anti-anti-sigma factor